MKKALTGIAFMLIFALAIGTAFAATLPTTGLQKSPYLIYPGVNTEMEVLWQDYDTETTNVVSWGLDTTYSGGSATVPEYNVGNNGHQHAYIITGLTPNTTYYYQVADATNGVYGTGSFITAPLANATSVRFFAQGDSRSQPYALASLDAAMTSFYSQPGNSDFQRLSIANGDWVSSDGESYWTQQWFTGLPGVTNYTANVPLNGCKGNHDNAGGYSATFPKYYPYPEYASAANALLPNGLLDSNNNPYYSNLYWSFDYGPVHFTMIDEYSPMPQGSAQYTWVQNDLAAASANPNTPWKIVVYHEPAYSAGADGDNTAVRVYDPLIAQYNVDLVFCGHSHNYARAGVYNSAQAAGDPIAWNVPYITSGGGGAPVYQTDWSNAAGWPHVITAWPSFEFMTFDIEGKTLTYTSYQVNNIRNTSDCPSVNSTGPWVPNCAAYTFPAPSYTPMETLFLHHFTNVSPQITYQIGGVVYNRATKTYNSTLTITNNGPALAGNVDVVLDGILFLPNINTNILNSPASAAGNGLQVQLINQYTTTGDAGVPAGQYPSTMIAHNPATGPTSPAGSGLISTVTLNNATGSNNGEPMIRATAGGIASGASVAIPLQFSNPTNVPITFNPITLME
jgi:hypothetical protein